MKKQFVTYKIALKLKELGFDEECFNYYHNDNEDITDTNFYLFEYCHAFGIKTSELQSNKGMENYISAPFWQQAIDWLREKHGWHIEVFPSEYINDKLMWRYGLTKIDKTCVVVGMEFPNIQNSNDVPMYPSYKKALKKAINYLLNKLKNEIH